MDVLNRDSATIHNEPFVPFSYSRQNMTSVEYILYAAERDFFLGNTTIEHQHFQHDAWILRGTFPHFSRCAQRHEPFYFESEIRRVADRPADNFWEHEGEFHVYHGGHWYRIGTLITHEPPSGAANNPNNPNNPTNNAVEPPLPPYIKKVALVAATIEL